MYDYAIDLDDFSKNYIEHQLKNEGFNAVFEKNLLILNCERSYNDGTRPMQTIDYYYKKTLSETLYAIRKQDVDIQDNLLEMLLKRHERNLEYEKENPPIVYSNRKAKRKNNTNRAPNKDVKPSSPVKDKQAKIANKLKLLTLKIKV